MSGPFDFGSKKPAAPAPAAPVARRAPTNPVEEHVKKALEVHPGVEAVRLRGRCATLMAMKVQDVIHWGERNLRPHQQAANIQAEIAKEFGRIDATTYLNAALTASQREPSIFEKLTAKKPEDHERILKSVRDDLSRLLVRAQALKDEYSPEVTDLMLDRISLETCAPDKFKDPRDKAIADNRVRTLLAAHQTGLMLMQVLDNAVIQCSDFIQQIDSFLSFTIPQMKLGNYGSR